MEALRGVGFGANDYLVEFEGEVEGAGAAVLECDKCGELCRILAQEDGGMGNSIGDSWRSPCEKKGS